MKDFKIGDIVVFVNQNKHEELPQTYPACGTKGEILSINPGLNVGDLFVQWTRGSTCFYDRWHCEFDDVVKEADDGEGR